MAKEKDLMKNLRIEAEHEDDLLDALIDQDLDHDCEHDCIYYKREDGLGVCPAFPLPEGIPDSILAGEVVHDKVWKSEQVGEFVFTQKKK